MGSYGARHYILPYLATWTTQIVFCPNMVHSGQLLRSTIKTEKSKHDSARAMISASFSSKRTNRGALV
jgi:hypothetical protein